MPDLAEHIELLLSIASALLAIVGYLVVRAWNDQRTMFKEFMKKVEDELEERPTFSDCSKKWTACAKEFEEIEEWKKNRPDLGGFISVRELGDHESRMTSDMMNYVENRVKHLTEWWISEMKVFRSEVSANFSETKSMISQNKTDVLAQVERLRLIQEGWHEVVKGK